MHIFSQPSDVTAWRLSQQTCPIVLVPTMGALHRGHLELIREAKKIVGPHGRVIISIFVNPLQFDRALDLSSYPKPLKDDLALCEEEAVDAVFCPAEKSMYADGHSIQIHETLLSRGLCGATRPGHFSGVCTVVLKLFMITGCTAAVFGCKDFQQLAIIQRMIRDLNLPVKIIAYPTVRETDGLAMSSRNTRLTPSHRADAPRIYQSLTAAAEIHEVPQMISAAEKILLDGEITRIDYLEHVDAETLQPALNRTRPSVLAAAVYYDDVRLIDHIDLPTIH